MKISQVDGSKRATETSFELRAVPETRLGAKYFREPLVPRTYHLPVRLEPLSFLTINPHLNNE